MIRSTRQRLAVLRVLESCDRPVTPAELHSLAKELDQGAGIGLRTIYRHIQELVQDGYLIGVDYPGQPLRYERVSPRGHHPHLICRVCHKVYPLEIEIPDLRPPNPPGFIIEGEEVIFFGRCDNPQCLSQSISESNSP